MGALFLDIDRSANGCSSFEGAAADLRPIRVEGGTAAFPSSGGGRLACASTGKTAGAHPSLRTLALFPTVTRACGWQANIEGDFSQLEADECLGAVIALQRLYALEPDRGA